MKITTSKNPNTQRPLLIISPENYGDELQIKAIKDNLSIPTGENFHEWQKEDGKWGISIFIDTNWH